MAHRLRTSAWFLALVAIILRAALPAGWMPLADASGTTSLVICTSHGPLAAPVHARTHAPLPGRTNDICPFAAVVHLAPPAPFALLPAPALNSRETDPAAYGQVVSLSKPWRSNHAPRAPPILRLTHPG